MACNARIVMKDFLSKYHGFNGLNSLVDFGDGAGTAMTELVIAYPSIKGINFDLPHVMAIAPYHPGEEAGKLDRVIFAKSTSPTKTPATRIVADEGGSDHKIRKFLIDSDLRIWKVKEWGLEKQRSLSIKKIRWVSLARLKHLLSLGLIML